MPDLPSNDPVDNIDLQVNKVVGVEETLLEIKEYGIKLVKSISGYELVKDGKRRLLDIDEDMLTNDKVIDTIIRTYLVDVFEIKDLETVYKLRDMIKAKLKELTPKKVRLENVKPTAKETLIKEITDIILRTKTIKTFITEASTRQGEVGIFCYEEGYYRPCNKDLEAEVEKILENSGLSEKSTRYIVNEVLAKIARKTVEHLHYDRRVIAFKNVLFDWDIFLQTGNLMNSISRFSPDVIVLHKIPHNLNIEMINKLKGLVKFKADLIDNLEEIANTFCPKTLKAFKDWVGGKWALLFEIIGYTLYPKYVLNKAIMLVGDGSNGKSTYLNLLRKVLGPHNIASIPLQDLIDKEFAVSNLYRKLANISGELPKKPLENTDKFKDLTGEDIISADVKFKDRITFENYAKLIFATNELPKTYDMTDAFWRRWIVIEFPNKFPPNPKFFEETFTENEVEGAIIVSLLAFYNVFKRKKFSFEESPEDYKRVWLKKTDSVIAFVEDLRSEGFENYVGVLDPEGYVGNDEFWDLYLRYCKENDITPVAKKTFTERLEKYYGIKKVCISGKAGKKCYYKGIRLKPKEPEPQDQTQT